MVALSAAISRSSGETILTQTAIRKSLQTPHAIGSPEFARLEAIFKNWNSWTIERSRNILSRSYRETVQAQRTRQRKLRRLGTKDRPLALAASGVSSCRERRRRGCPGTIAGSGAAGRNAAGVSPPRGRPVQSSKICFMGERTLEEYWPRIVRWMKEVDRKSVRLAQAV